MQTNTDMLTRAPARQGMPATRRTTALLRVRLLLCGLLAAQLMNGAAHAEVLSLKCVGSDRAYFVRVSDADKSVTLEWSITTKQGYPMHTVLKFTDGVTGSILKELSSSDQMVQAAMVPFLRMAFDIRGKQFLQPGQGEMDFGVVSDGKRMQYSIGGDGIFRNPEGVILGTCTVLHL